MRWILFAIVAYAVILIQSTLGRVMAFDLAPVGYIGPDLAALFALMLALSTRSATDAMLAGWFIGFALDLTTGGGAGGGAVVGPMALGYALAARAVFSVREAVFAGRAITRALLALGFCLIAHGLWVTVQSVLAWRDVTLGDWAERLAQAGAIAVYTALVAPFVTPLLVRVQHWLVVQPVGRGSR